MSGPKGKFKYTDDDIFPWGKHKGKKFCNVPASYLLYMFDMPYISEWPGIYDYIDENFDQLLEERTKEWNHNGT